MYAVVRIQGQQLRVEPDQTIDVPRLRVEVGTRLELSEVLAIGGDGSIQIGRPLVDGARVDAEVVAHHRGPKIRVFKYKRRKDYRRVRGHRTDLTALKIHAVQSGGTPPAEPPAAEDETTA